MARSAVRELRSEVGNSDCNQRAAGYNISDSLERPSVTEPMINEQISSPSRSPAPGR